MKKIPADVWIVLIPAALCITSLLIIYWPFVQAVLDGLKFFKFW